MSEFYYQYVTPESEIEQARARAVEQQQDMDEAIHDAVQMAINRMVPDLSNHVLRSLTDLVRSDDMIEALGFERKWEYGNWNAPNDAESEGDAHRRAMRDPEVNGGHVRYVWERPSVWMPHDEAVAARQERNAQIAAMGRRHAEERRALEAQHAMELARLEQES